MAIKNNSWAMIATVCAAAAVASVIGFLNPSNCVEAVQQPGWTSCEAIANEQRFMFIGLLGLSLFGFAISIYKKSRK